MPLIRWTDEKISQLKNLIADGLSYKEIAQRMGVTIPAVVGVIVYRNLPHPTVSSKKPKWSKEKRNEIIRLRREGKTYREIARIFAVPATTIHGVICMYNLPRKVKRRDWSKSPELIAEMKRLFRLGRPNLEVAAYLGVKTSYVKTLARKFGITRTKEEIKSAVHNVRNARTVAKRELELNNLRKHLSPYRHSSDIGYLIGCFRGAVKCKCKHLLHYVTTNIHVVRRIAQILAKVTDRKVSIYRRLLRKGTGYQYAITQGNRALSSYLSIFTEELKKRYPRRLGRLGLVGGFSQALHKVLRNYSRFPLDLPTAKKRKSQGHFSKRWWHKIKREFALGFVQAIWDADGRIRIGRKDKLPNALTVKIEDPFIAEYLIWAQRKIGITGGYIKILSQHRHWKRWKRKRYIIILQRQRSIEQFARVLLPFPDSERNEKVKKLLTIIKN